MRFRVKRTSRNWEFECPLEGATEERYIQKVPKGVDYERSNWWITVPSLNALLILIKKEGRVIVDVEGESPTIEIYDDYRE